jgi:hypothetical protein
MRRSTGPHSSSRVNGIDRPRAPALNFLLRVAWTSRPWLASARIAVSRQERNPGGRDEIPQTRTGKFILVLAALLCLRQLLILSVDILEQRIPSASLVPVAPSLLRQTAERRPAPPWSSCGTLPHAFVSHLGTGILHPNGANQFDHGTFTRSVLKRDCVGKLLRESAGGIIHADVKER